MTTYDGLGYWREHPPKWPTVPLRKVARLGTGHTPSRLEPDYWVNCTVPWVTTADLTARTDGGLQPLMETTQHVSELGLANSAAVLHPTDTVMLSRTASIGHSVRIGRPMATTQAFVTWTCGPQLDPRYLLLVMNAMKPEFDRLAYGSTHLTIYFPDIEQLRVPLPPLHVQSVIADHLDRETARIDALIKKKQRLIELLNEQFWVAVSQVLWAENVSVVPLAMRTQQMRPIMYGIVLPGPDVPGGVPIVKGGDVAARRLSPGQLNRTTPEIERPYARARLAEGDLVFAIRGGIGDVEIVPPELAGANITQDVARVAPAPDVDPAWLRLVLRSHPVRVDIERRITGATIKGLNIFELKRLAVPSSSSDRQRRDMAYLASREIAWERLTDSLHRQINLLRERRQALITAEVSGELEVPGVAA